jgi:mannosyl-oligosaccharide alpha-1,2-mannosidase
MWRTTGDVKWRERGYGIFQAIEKHARTRFGYTTVRGIDGHHGVQQLDDMPRYNFILFITLPLTLFLCCYSWFLAETLKYLYLLFDDTDSFKLDEWVFNSEGHPLPVFSWTAKERRTFGI